MVAQLRGIRIVGGILIGVVFTIFSASGCDGGGSKRDALYGNLVGVWEVQRVYLDGQRTSNFGQAEVRLEFVSQGDGRSYRLTRTVRGDTSTVRGTVQVPESNALSMTGRAFTLVWRFSFEEPDDLSDSVRFRLARAGEESTESFLSAIGLGGNAGSITMDLIRDPE